MLLNKNAINDKLSEQAPSIPIQINNNNQIPPVLNQCKLATPENTPNLVNIDQSMPNSDDGKSLPKVIHHPEQMKQVNNDNFLPTVQSQYSMSNGKLSIYL